MILRFAIEVFSSDSSEGFSSLDLGLLFGINPLPYERMPFPGLDPCCFKRERSEGAKASRSWMGRAGITNDKHIAFRTLVSDADAEAGNDCVPYDLALAFRCSAQGSNAAIS